MFRRNSRHITELVQHRSDTDQIHPSAHAPPFGNNHNITLPATLTDIAMYDYIEFLAGSDVPLTLIRCHDDRQINQTLAASLTMLNTRKKSNIVDLTNAGHLVNIDAETEFNELLLTIINYSWPI